MATANNYPARTNGDGQYDPDSRHQKITTETEERVWRISRENRGAIDARLSELDDEWDIEHLLKLQAATFALKFLLFGKIVDKKYYWGVGLVGAFMLQQAIRGSSAPYALYRRFGKRTAREINEERYALKSLRGDFDGVDNGNSGVSAMRAIRAARGDV